MNKNTYWQRPDTKQKIIDALQHNEILVTTTDTIPGLLANITELSFTALNRIKKERQAKPYIILISDLTKLEYFIDTPNPKIKSLLSKCWPGPLTVIFKSKHNLPKFLKSDKGTVALRCPAYTPLLEILKHFNGLFSTSANRSSRPAPQKTEYLDPEVVAQVKYVVNDESQGIVSPMPSTIIDISREDGNFYVVRPGAYTTEALAEIWKQSDT